MKKILVIYTGGTIGMHRENKNGTLKPYNFDNLLDQLPELKKLNCKLSFHSFVKPIDSSNVSPLFWEKLGRVIATHYNKYNGFVILHGTDTMAYTACALSYMLTNINKPVILTGSQLPLGEIRSDARRNLIASIEIASHSVSLNEVCIFFNNKLFRGNRSEKYSSSKFDAFHSLNYPHLAETGVNITFFKEHFLAVPKKNTFKLKTGFNTNVMLIKLFPGIGNSILKHILSEPNLKAIVIETYGSGNAPNDKLFLNTLQQAIKKNIVVVNVSQCSGGRVIQGKYETSMGLKNVGVISGGDITTEAAITKLMFQFGQGLNADSVKKQFPASLAGELSL